MSVLATKLRRDLRRNRSQVVAITITVFLGIALFGASFDAYRSLEASYQSLYDDLEFADLWVSGGDVEAFAADAAETDGVAAVVTRIQADVPMRPVESHSMLGRVVGMPVGAQPPVNAVSVVRGRYFAGGGEAMVEQHLADHFDLAVGDTIRVGEELRPLTVAGIVASPEYLWPAPSRQVIIATPEDFGVVFIGDDLVREVAGAGAVEQATVRFDDDADHDVVAAELRTSAAGTGAVDVYGAAEQPSNWALQTDVKGFGDLSFMFPLLFLTAAGLGTWVMLTRLVVAQRAVIGTLVASGMSRRSLFRHYLSYGLVIGLAGAIPGVIAGAVLARYAAGMYTEALSIPVTVVRIDAITPVVGVLFGIVAGLLAAAFPARRAVRMSPAESMRGLAPTGPGRPTLPERIVPPLRRLSATSLLVLRGVFRNPRRTFSTILGVVLSLTLILVSWGMIDTVDHLVGRQFDEIQRDDARVVLAAPASAGDIAALMSVPGVAAAEPTVSVRVTVESATGRYSTSLEGLPAETTMHRFLGPDGEMALPDGGILLGLDLEGLLGIDVGDDVTLRAPALGVVTTERVAGFVDEPLGTFAYASLEHMAGLMAGAGPVDDASGSAVVAGALVRYDEGADPDGARRYRGRSRCARRGKHLGPAGHAEQLPRAVLCLRGHHAGVRRCARLRHRVQHDGGQPCREDGGGRHASGGRGHAASHRPTGHRREPPGDGAGRGPGSPDRLSGGVGVHGRLRQRPVLIRSVRPAVDAGPVGAVHRGGDPDQPDPGLRALRRLDIAEVVRERAV